MWSQELDANDPYGFFPTQDILWFYEWISRWQLSVPRSLHLLCTQTSRFRPVIRVEHPLCMHMTQQSEVSHAVRGYYVWRRAGSALGCTPGTGFVSFPLKRLVQSHQTSSAEQSSVQEAGGARESALKLCCCSKEKCRFNQIYFCLLWKRYENVPALGTK